MNAIDRIEEIVRTMGIMGNLDREGVTHCIERIKKIGMFTFRA